MIVLPGVPDPHESVLQCKFPVFDAGIVDSKGDLWLPDISNVLGFPAVDPGDVLEAKYFRPRPEEAGFPMNEREVAIQSAQIAEWIFETYAVLVYLRLHFYNKRRRLYLKTPDNTTAQRHYRFAAERAIEQMVRRDYIQVDSVRPNFFHPVLPVFMISIKLQLGGDNTVYFMDISGAVEVRQRVYQQDLKVGIEEAFDADRLVQPSWSSSSSSYSSSHSSFDPNA
jgi:hypothetical protein